IQIKDGYANTIGGAATVNGNVISGNAGPGVTLTSNLVNAGSAFVGPLSGAIADWKGEGNANDSAGANNGTLQGGAAFTSGVSGQAFSFDGSTGYVQFASHVVPTSGSFSVTLFEKSNSPQSGSFVEWISQGSSGGPGFYIGHNTSGIIRVGDA